MSSSQSTTTETEDARAARVRQVQELENAILSTPALQGQPHAHVLTALLAIYIRMAIANPCCTEACAVQATSAVFTLGQHAASTAPQGAPIH